MHTGSNSEDPSPSTLPRFIALLGRRWWLLPVAFVVFALLGGAIGRGTIRAQADIALREPAPSSLASQILDLRIKIPLRSKSEFAQALITSTMADRLKQEIPGTALQVIDSSVFGGFRLDVTGPTTTKTVAALDWSIHEAEAYRATEAKDLYTKMKSILDERQNVLEAREAELTTELTKPAPAGVIAALGTERRTVRQDLDNLSSGSAIVRRLAADPTGGLQVVRRTDPQKLGSRISLTSPKSIALGVIGVLLAMATLATVAALDKRVRSRTDVEGVAGAGALTAIVDDNQSNVAVLALSARFVAAQRNMTSALLVPLGSSSGRSVAVGRLADASAAALADPRLGAATGFTFAASETYPASTSALADAATGYGAVYLVAESGVTHKDDLALAVRSFAAAGVPLAGVVLCGVRAADLRSAGR